MLIGQIEPPGRRVEGHDDELVERKPEQRALLLHHADDAVRQAADPDLLADRVDALEKLVAPPRSPITTHRQRGADLLRGEKARPAATS